MQSHTESAQRLHLFCLYQNQDFFCIPFPWTVLCTLSSGLGGLWVFYDPLLIKAAAVAAKSLQSCPTLCDPIDSSPSGSAIPGILQARTLEWVAILPENLFSLEMFFLYISNLCQPQKMLNRVTFFMEQRCSELQERKNQLAQRSDVVNFKATLVFLTLQLC